ncbi:GNAT family N-acetyltransferase [Micromonospora deserti]|uniref:GNAT family N-acetyltransferase n=1 Tax=Micromonospora deserti TaxID=2070366 RepID=A0A2W2D8P1_9ACTN|nr:GNAT family N-acetyltransferase [Micromonospora deserti]PZG01735.1 GNAT family N-acetyltransferase [Micromonospora deserti]
MTWHDKRVNFRIAQPDQAAEVLGVLDEAAAWLAQRSIHQWPARFESSWIEDALQRGETWLVEVDNTVTGTFTLDWADPLWNDVAGNAGYLHRVAIRRRTSGLGAVILSWAKGTVHQHARHALRLDCVTANPRLRAYYEAAGFVHRGDVLVAGAAPGQRQTHGQTTLVSRYELRLNC